MEKFVFKVKLTYKTSTGVDVYQVASILADSEGEAILKAYKRHKIWQDDISQYKVLWRFDFQSIKVITELAKDRDTYVFYTDRYNDCEDIKRISNDTSKRSIWVIAKQGWRRINEFPN